jgi:UDP-3-O-[3-hydroxymyristoyl] glucosamine N-acyltransferase
MEHPGFFDRAGPFTLAEVAAASEAVVAPGADGAVTVSDIRPLSDAAHAHVSFLDNKKYLEQASVTNAGACFIAQPFAARLPSTTVPLIGKSPYRSFALALRLFYPDSLWSKAAGSGTAPIDPTAVLEPGVVVEPGAIIGPEVHIGRGSRIAAGAVVGYRCSIGRGSYIGPGATVIHALVGDRVILHAGVRVGQDGFGFAMGRAGHLKVPQIGRVIIQDDVEIGACTCIDRGALKDTIIGEGTKIDNLVQIGHNVIVGRHAVIVGQVGLSGSCELGDFVVMGGHSGAVGHVRIGAGAQVAGSSHVNEDIPPGARVGGTPAVPFREWGRQLAAIKRLGRKSSRKDTGGEQDET